MTILLLLINAEQEIETTLTKVEEVAHEKLSTDRGMAYLSQEQQVKEILAELDRWAKMVSKNEMRFTALYRFPILDRAVESVRSLSDPAFSTRMRQSLQGILKEAERGPDADSETPQINGTSHSRIRVNATRFKGHAKDLISNLSITQQHQKQNQVWQLIMKRITPFDKQAKREHRTISS